MYPQTRKKTTASRQRPSRFNLDVGMIRPRIGVGGLPVLSSVFRLRGPFLLMESASTIGYVPPDDVGRTSSWAPLTPCLDSYPDHSGDMLLDEITPNPVVPG